MRYIKILVGRSNGSRSLIPRFLEYASFLEFSSYPRTLSPVGKGNGLASEV